MQIYFYFRYFMRMIVKNFFCFIAILIFFAPSTCITGKSPQFSGTNVLQFNILTRSILKVAMNFTLSTWGQVQWFSKEWSTGNKISFSNQHIVIFIVIVIVSHSCYVLWQIKSSTWNFKLNLFISLYITCHVSQTKKMLWK